MVAEDTFTQAELAACLPALQKFALKLAKSQDRADDVVADALLKAWKARHNFQPGTSLQAWLFVITRNSFLTQLRKRKEVEDPEGHYEAALSVEATQGASFITDDLRAALTHVPFDMREAIILVSICGLSYDEAAEILQIQVGTVKSHVSRGRSILADHIDLTS